MNATKIILGRTEISKGWRIAVMGLMAAISLAILIGGPLFAPRHVAYAAPMRGNEPWLKIKCVETLVEEGEDFRLEVRKKHDSDWPHPTMRVFWYTDAITADETDYEHLYAERQSSNGSQSESGVMGRNFNTLDDNYPEIDETFKVQFNNSVDKGNKVDERECIITIWTTTVSASTILRSLPSRGRSLLRPEMKSWRMARAMSSRFPRTSRVP